MNNTECELISIIVPVYNVEKYLNTCIKSLVNQSYKNIEIILVDDGSTDGCASICDDWSKTDQRIKVIHKLNGGLSDARNNGLMIASGAYIGYVDSDDYVAEDMYEKLLAAIYEDESDLAACSVLKIDENGNLLNPLILNKRSVFECQDAQRELLQESAFLNPVWYKLYKRDLIENESFPVGKLHEDVFWSYKVFGKVKKVSTIPEIGYYYRQRSDSIMGEAYNLRHLDAMSALCERQQYLERSFPELSAQGILSIWNQAIYQGQCALLYLEQNKKNYAFRVLKSVLIRYPLTRDCYRGEAIKRKMTLITAKMSLILTCRLRNLLKMGF